jgi:hypothetical protein
MGRNFPSRRIRRRFSVWRDRRRYPWRYPETEGHRFGRRAPQASRRRFFVIRSVGDGRNDHFIFAECPNYAAALEVAAIADDRVFTEGQMLDHPQRLQVLSAWDRGEAPKRGRRPKAEPSRRRDPSETLSGIEARHG